MMMGTIVVPPLFVYFLDCCPYAIPLGITFSLFLVYLEFRYAKPWSDYRDND